MTYKSILCLNGDLPPKSFFDKMDYPIIAADGAANTLHSMGLKPQIVIGDLDSVRWDLKVRSLCIYDQNQCDYEKSMAYLEKEGLQPAIILGINGGHLDHILNNISIFMGQRAGNLLYAPPLYGMVLPPSITRLTFSETTKVSILGLPEARIITKGLEWELSGQRLYFPGVTSCLNQSKGSQIDVTVLEGQALFLAHDFFIQNE